MRVKLKQFSSYPFETNFKIRVNDINYGNHLSNDKYLSFAHQARIEFFEAINASELDFFGVGIIMADAAIRFMAEGRLNDEITAGVVVDNISKLGFDLYYRYTRNSDNSILGEVKTAIICFDYNQGKVTRLPEAAKVVLERYTDSKD